MTNDRTLGIAALSLAAIMIAYGYGLDAPFVYEPVGPKAFPLFAAGLIAICGLVLVIKGGGAIEKAGPGVGRALLLLGLSLLAYAVLFQPLGYIVSTTLLMVPIAMIFGARWWQGLLTGAALGVFGYLLFDRALSVVLPAGILGGII
ncbi:putative tricarboxylic transport membrane protein [Devosia lucknowensis]|uniref:Putative tricarboxylic transport membrane protein n=1 Tax=Devosia lucknowensis TaxID=1096929 RepID=A0A1Y6F1I0_9HYPH|nr:tripartite tricarboxylate transporter TctB family protein [Devosia lucknowensis]SMQ68647.1 putative tricarboxylic transport membrane protein [Devosia lucknowensis]